MVYARKTKQGRAKWSLTTSKCLKLLWVAGVEAVRLKACSHRNASNMDEGSDGLSSEAFMVERIRKRVWEGKSWKPEYFLTSGRFTHSAFRLSVSESLENGHRKLWRGGAFTCNALTRWRVLTPQQSLSSPAGPGIRHLVCVGLQNVSYHVHNKYYDLTFCIRMLVELQAGRLISHWPRVCGFQHL